MADVTRISLDKSCDISKAEGMHERLEALLNGSNPIEVDASAVERIDTSHMQLLASFIRTLNQHHIDVRITSPSSGFVEAARLIGLAPLFGIQN